MPTYEAIAAVAMVFVVWGVTKLHHAAGILLAGVVAAGCVYAVLAWGVWFGGPVILLGTAIGLAWGLASRRMGASAGH